jgi:hypothetical protein
MTGELTRWRLNLADDSTITFDEATGTITKIITGENLRKPSQQRAARQFYFVDDDLCADRNH